MSGTDPPRRSFGLGRGPSLPRPIAGTGTLLGVAIVLVTCHVVSRYGYHLDPRVYLIDRLQIEVKPLEVMLVAGITMAISVIATAVPSRSAAALRPVDGLRYD